MGDGEERERQIDDLDSPFKLRRARHKRVREKHWD